jgi:hypothetical protein
MCTHSNVLEVALGSSCRAIPRSSTPPGGGITDKSSDRSSILRHALSSPTYAFAQRYAPALETWYALACPQRIVYQLISQVTVPDILMDIPGRRTFVSEERRSSVSPEMVE